MTHPNKLTAQPDPAVLALFHKLESLMEQLYSRWQDEKKYEDINDYGQAISKALPVGFSLMKSSKSPFGFQIQSPWDRVYFFKFARGSYSYRRIA